VIAIVIVSLAALTLFTFLMVLVTIASLSRAKKHLFVVAEENSELREKHAAFEHVKHSVSNAIARLAEIDDKIETIERRSDEWDSKILSLAETADKIESIRRRLNDCDSKIAESQNHLAEHKSKLNEHDTLLAQAGQMMGRESSDFNQTIQRVRLLEQDFQNLKGFQRTFEQTRDRILNALSAIPVRMPSQNTLTTEQKDIRRETVTPSEERQPDTEDFRFKTRYP
jgi:chromosome segregation ATPase